MIKPDSWKTQFDASSVLVVYINNYTELQEVLDFAYDQRGFKLIALTDTNHNYTAVLGPGR